jgi:hypothetical protein
MRDFLKKHGAGEIPPKKSLTSFLVDELGKNSLLRRFARYATRSRTDPDQCCAETMENSLKFASTDITLHRQCKSEDLARRFSLQNLKHGQRLFRRGRLSMRIPVRDSRSLNAKHPGKFSLFNVVCYAPRFDVGQ